MIDIVCTLGHDAVDVGCCCCCVVVVVDDYVVGVLVELLLGM